MQRNYSGLPPAASVQQAILLAQRLMMKERERSVLRRTGERPDLTRSAHPIRQG